MNHYTIDSTHIGSTSYFAAGADPRDADAGAGPSTRVAAVPRLHRPAAPPDVRAQARAWDTLEAELCNIPPALRRKTMWCSGCNDAYAKGAAGGAFGETAVTVTLFDEDSASASSSSSSSYAGESEETEETDADLDGYPPRFRRRLGRYNPMGSSGTAPRPGKRRTTPQAEEKLPTGGADYHQANTSVSTLLTWQVIPRSVAASCSPAPAPAANPKPERKRVRFGDKPQAVGTRASTRLRERGGAGCVVVAS
ncbi:hypothetical protein BC834DRAFT_867212 [Gloeopeniophorella convolvens]|nr:hypothetical protein BC834DRAFT_867212 [Gloeopeniophorella convolvens]